MKERATGEDIFNLTNEYFQENEIDLFLCKVTCKDGRNQCQVTAVGLWP